MSYQPDTFGMVVEMPTLKVAVAMSGGVDSSVAAFLLRQQGYDVAGVTHQIWFQEEQSFEVNRGTDAIDCSRIVADKIGIPHYVIDLRNEFIQEVVVPFCEAYENGRTPNPCVWCNQMIRFGTMLRRLKSLGFDFMATGHYASVEKEDGCYYIKKAYDQSKDQSYFLYTLGQEELRYILLPLGSYLKTQVRQIARELSLPNADREESQDICFIRGDYRDFIKRFVNLEPGDIVDVNGKILGRHEGLALYTIGQRHGMGISSNEPLYVVRLDKKENRLVVGTREYLYSKILLVKGINWISGRAPEFPCKVTAKVRYKAPESEATLFEYANGVRVVFKEPQMAVTPGQSVVFYTGNFMVGGGIIEEVAIDYAFT